MADGCEHTGHRERLRERAEKEGLTHFSPHEVLELLLTYAIPRGDVNPLAHRLLRHFGSLSRVFEASIAELQQVSGIGPRAASLLGMILPLFQRYQMEKLTPRQQVGNYALLTAYCRTLFLGASSESFYMICLDGRLNAISAVCVSSGTPMEVSVAPRLIVRNALQWDAVGVVITHNHPSGNPAPSQEDVDLTRRIMQALDSVDIRLYDHVIVGGQEVFSFRRNGLMNEEYPAMPRPLLDETDLAAERPQRNLPPRRKK